MPLPPTNTTPQPRGDIRYPNTRPGFPHTYVHYQPSFSPQKGQNLIASSNKDPMSSKPSLECSCFSDQDPPQYSIVQSVSAIPPHLCSLDSGIIILVAEQVLAAQWAIIKPSEEPHSEFHPRSPPGLPFNSPPHAQFRQHNRR